MGTMVGIRRQGLYRLDVAAKLIRHDNARWPELPASSEKKRLATLVLRRG